MEVYTVSPQVNNQTFDDGSGRDRWYAARAYSAGVPIVKPEHFLLEPPDGNVIRFFYGNIVFMAGKPHEPMDRCDI